jgi:phage tail-like protein
MAIQVITRQIDPLKNFKFTVSFETGGPIAGVSKVSGLKRTTEVMSHRDGGMISTVVNSPGQSKFEAITLERGITLDETFEQWANTSHSPLGDGGVSLAAFRRNLIITMNNLQGEAVRAWNVYGCWVSEYNVTPELDANGNSFAFESIVLQNHGFMRDPEVTEDVAGFTTV